MTPLLRSARQVVSRHPRETGAVTLGALALLLLVSTGLWRQTTPVWPLAAATRAPFEETLVESGVVSAQRLMLYASTIPGAQAKIAEIAEEGKAVSAGDLLVRFDATTFEQTRERERAALRQAEAELDRAREEFTLEGLRAAGDLNAARQQVNFAETGLTNQIDGRGRVEVIEAEAAASEAARQLLRAKSVYDDLKPLLEEGFITRAELDRAEQEWRRAEELKRLADLRLEALVRFERPAASDRARAELQTARDGLARQQESSASRTAERQAGVVLAQSRAQEIRARLAMLDQQIERATIRAQGPGLVVYRDLYFGGDRRKPQVGDEVFPNQPLIALPDSSQFIVDLRIREIDLHRIAADQHVEVRVDAYPDLRLPAEVSLVGALAQEDATRAGTKYFPVTVKLTGADARLRPGMTARVDIHVRSLPDALVVPIEAVYEKNGQPTVFVMRGTAWERRIVKPLAENDTHVAIERGLVDGERVILADPTVARAH